MKPSRDEIIRTLRALLLELEARYGMTGVALFGSMARGDYEDESDVDLMAAFSRPVGWEIVAIEEELQDRLQRKVQVFNIKALEHSRLAPQIRQDLVSIA